MLLIPSNGINPGKWHDLINKGLLINQQALLLINSKDHMTFPPMEKSPDLTDQCTGYFLSRVRLVSFQRCCQRWSSPVHPANAITLSSNLQSLASQHSSLVCHRLRHRFVTGLAITNTLGLAPKQKEVYLIKELIQPKSDGPWRKYINNNSSLPCSFPDNENHC